MQLSRNDRLKLYRNLVLVRAFEEKMVDSYRRGKVPSFYHSGLGQEGVGVGGCTFLRRDDYLMPTHRGRGHVIAKTDGTLLREIFAELYGRVTGLAKGKGGEHGAAVEYGIFGGSGSIGGCFPIAVGLGTAAKKFDRGQVVVCFFGDGAANRGTMHEAMNWAAAFRLPIVWVCENNLYAITMSVREAMAIEDIAQMAASYAMPGIIVDGNDVEAVCHAVMDAVERARAGEGPSLIECKTYRWREHSEMEPPSNYRPKEEVEAWKAKDPVLRYEKKLLAEGLITPADVESVWQEARQRVDEAEAQAYADPWPDPEMAFQGVYAE
jgi:TPP-dependent pyruvate/acetoin dehydrogenase alpha subunit